MMKKKALKIFLIFSITFSFAQNYTPLNLSIKGMHCAGGCAKMIENSLNQNKGISAAVNFNTSSASIIYDKDITSEGLDAPAAHGRQLGPRLLDVVARRRE